MQRWGWVGSVCIALLVAATLAYAGTGTLTWSPVTKDELGGTEVVAIYRAYYGPVGCNSESGRTLKKEVGGDKTTMDITVDDTATVVSAQLTAEDGSKNESKKSICVEKVFPLPAAKNFRYDEPLQMFLWEPVAGAKGYKLFVHESGTPYECNATNFLCVAETATSRKVVLKTATTYDTWLVTVNVQDVDGGSSGLTFTTSTPPVDKTPPAPPADVQFKP